MQGNDENKQIKSTTTLATNMPEESNPVKQEDGKIDRKISRSSHRSSPAGSSRQRSSRHGSQRGRSRSKRKLSIEKAQSNEARQTTLDGQEQKHTSLHSKSPRERPLKSSTRKFSLEEHIQSVFTRNEDDYEDEKDTEKQVWMLLSVSVNKSNSFSAIHHDNH